MKISRADWREQTRNRWGYTVVVTRYTGRSTVVETFGPFNRNDALKAVWKGLSIEQREAHSGVFAEVKERIS
jgi:hypothetical protein